MKFFIICMTMAIFGALSHAAPLGTESRPFRAHITFKGAPPEVAFFTHSFVVDGTLTRIGASTCSSASSSFISSATTLSSSCFLFSQILISLTPGNQRTHCQSRKSNPTAEQPVPFTESTDAPRSLMTRKRLTSVRRRHRSQVLAWHCKVEMRSRCVEKNSGTWERTRLEEAKDTKYINM